MCTACAAPADMMERAIEQAPARVTDVSLSNQIDGKRSWNRYVSDPRCSSPALTAMPLSQVGWCHILLRSDPRPRRAALRDFSPVYVRFSNRPSGSSTFRLSTTPVSMSLTGSRFSSDSAPRPFHHGDSKTRWNNLSGGLAVNMTAGPSGQTISPHPSSRAGHHSTARWSSISSYRI